MKYIWTNLKQVWRRVLSCQKDWKAPFKELEGGKAGDVLRTGVETNQSSLTLGARLRCVDFGWITSWMLTARKDGRASIEYLKSHPEDDGGIHVVT